MIPNSPFLLSVTNQIPNSHLNDLRLLFFFFLFFIFSQVYDSWALKMTCNYVHISSWWFISSTVIHPLIKSNNPLFKLCQFSVKNRACWEKNSRVPFPLFFFLILNLNWTFNEKHTFSRNFKFWCLDPMAPVSNVLSWLLKDADRCENLLKPVPK